MAPSLRQKRTLTSSWSTGRKRVVHTPARFPHSITKSTVASKGNKKVAAGGNRPSDGRNNALVPAAARRKAAVVAAVDAMAEDLVNRRITRSNKKLLQPSLAPPTPSESSAQSDPESEVESEVESEAESQVDVYASPAPSVARSRGRRRSSAGQFTLFGLPTEIRLMIFRFALDASSRVQVAIGHDTLVITNQLSDVLQRTCKQVRLEVLDVISHKKGLAEHTTLETAARGASLARLFHLDAWPNDLNWVPPRESLQNLVVNWVLPPNVRAKGQGIGVAEINMLVNARSALRRFHNLYSFTIYTTNFTNSGGRRRSRRACGEAIYCIEFVEKERAADQEVDIVEYEPVTKLDSMQVASLDGSLLRAFPASGPIVSLGSCRVAWTRFVRVSRRTLVWNTDEDDQDAAYASARRTSSEPYKSTMNRFLEEELSLGTASKDALVELTHSLTRVDRGPATRWQVRIFRMAL